MSDTIDADPSSHTHTPTHSLVVFHADSDSEHEFSSDSTTETETATVIQAARQGAEPAAATVSQSTLDATQPPIHNDSTHSSTVVTIHTAANVTVESELQSSTN